jgi:hypothetical protein
VQAVDASLLEVQVNNSTPGLKLLSRMLILGVEPSIPHPSNIEMINNALGVSGKLERVTGLNNSYIKTLDYPAIVEAGSLLYNICRPIKPTRSVRFHDVWFGEAEPGKTLTWN